MTATADPIIVLSAQPHLRAALDTAAAVLGVTLVHTDAVPTARTAARNARMLIIGIQDAHWVHKPIGCAGPAVLIAADDVDRDRVAGHAHRLGAELFLLRPPGHRTLVELLRRGIGDRCERRTGDSPPGNER
jgi:hypothetical protein